MKTPKIIQRPNGIFYISYIDATGSRVRTSLRTSNIRIAEARFHEHTGFFPSPETQPAVIPTPPPPKPEKKEIRFIDAYNQFMKSEYGIENAWLHKILARCNKYQLLLQAR